MSPEYGIEVAVIVPVPEALRLAPVPTDIVAVVLVPEVRPLKAMDVPFTVQDPPKVQVCPLTVVDALARDEFGIALAVTESVGVVVDVATLGTNHVGQLPALAMKFVTLPPPLPLPVKVQVVPAQDPAPAPKLKVKAPPVPLIDVTPEPELTETLPAVSTARNPAVPTPGIPENFALPASINEFTETAAGKVNVDAEVTE